MSNRFKTPLELKIGRQYHLNQINKHSPYLLLELKDDKARVLRLDRNERERWVSISKLKATRRHEPERSKTDGSS